MSQHIKGLIAINIAAIIFGSAALYGKLNVSPFWIVAMRGIFAAITLLIIGTRKERDHQSGKKPPRLNNYRRDPFIPLAHILYIGSAFRCSHRYSYFRCIPSLHFDHRSTKK
jgi:hypothetical protein